MGFLSSILHSVQNASGPSSAMGVDIGSSSIKVVELEEREGVLTLVTYGEVQLGPYAGKGLGSTVHLEPKQEQAAFVDVVRESAVKSRDAVFAMPLASSFISSTTIAADEDADLSAMVRVEARKLIPASLSEVTLDWAELSSTSGSQTGRPVLIAAIQNSAIERFNILMQFAGFNNAATEIECFSANRTVDSSKNALVIDFGAASTKMYLSQSGVLNRMHRVNVGGAMITAALTKITGEDFETTENTKLQLQPDDRLYQQTRELYEAQYGRALREFRQVLNHYTADTDITFDAVQICGGASAQPFVKQLVQPAFSLDVESINPFTAVAYPAFMEDTIKQIGPTFVPALGAALRSFE